MELATKFKGILRWGLAIIISVIVLLLILHLGSVWINYREYGYIGQFFSSCASYIFATGVSVLSGIFISKCDYKKGLIFAVIDWLIVLALLITFEEFISNSAINVVLYVFYFLSSLIGGGCAIISYKENE